MKFRWSRPVWRYESAHAWYPYESCWDLGPVGVTGCVGPIGSTGTP